MRNSLITLGLIVFFNTAAQTTSTKESSRTTSSVDGVSNESSVTRSTEYYKFDARYQEIKNEVVRDLLTDRLGTSYLTVHDDTFLWKRGKGSTGFFSCLLSENELHLKLNRSMASEDFYDLVNELGDDLTRLIQTHQSPQFTMIDAGSVYNPNSQDPQLLTQELVEAEREFERAKRNLERVQQKKKQR